MNIPFDPTSSFSLPSALIKNHHPEIYFPANESIVSRIFHSSNFHNLRSSPHHNFKEYVSYRTFFAPFNRSPCEYVLFDPRTSNSFSYYYSRILLKKKKCQIYPVNYMYSLGLQKRSENRRIDISHVTIQYNTTEVTEVILGTAVTEIVAMIDRHRTRILSSPGGN